MGWSCCCPEPRAEQQRDLCIVCCISNEGRCCHGEGLPRVLGAPQVSVQDGGSTSSALCGRVLPLLICLLAMVPVAARALATHLLVRLSWNPQRRQWAGHRPQDLPLLLRSIHFFPGEQRQEQAARQPWSWAMFRSHHQHSFD